MTSDAVVTVAKKPHAGTAGGLGVSGEWLSLKEVSGSKTVFTARIVCALTWVKSEEAPGWPSRRQLLRRYFVWREHFTGRTLKRALDRMRCDGRNTNEPHLPAAYGAAWPLGEQGCCA